MSLSRHPDRQHDDSDESEGSQRSKSDTTSDDSRPTMKWDSEEDWDAILEGSVESENNSDDESTIETGVEAGTKTEAETEAEFEFGQTQTEMGLTESESATAVVNPTPHSSATQPPGAVPEDLIQIGPISEATLEVMAAVLPPAWLETADDKQRMVQWVVYAYLNETNTTFPTLTRMKSGIDRAADELGENSPAVTVFCAKTMYEGEDDSSRDQFYRDLEAIEAQVDVDAT